MAYTLSDIKGLIGALAPVQTAHQNQARNLLQERQFPTRRDEEWRYTPLKALLEKEITLDPVTDIDSSVLDPLKAILPNALHLVFIDGQFSQTDSDSLEDLETGLSIDRISTLGDDKESRVNSMVNDAQFTDDNLFQQLALSLSQDGLFIDVAMNVEIEKQIHIINFGSNDSASLSAPLLFAHLHANSRLTLVQHYVSNNAAALTVPGEYIRLEEGSGLKQFRIGLESMQTDHIANTHAHVAGSAAYESHQYLFGSKLTRSNTEVTFAGSGADVQLRGLYLGSDDQHLDVRTYVDHVHGNCVSDQHFRGILADRARGVFNGLVMVQKDAQQTNAEQSNKNLLLSRDARVDTKPQLEIYADDVRCAHGATVGELDSDALFYLQSRGIDREEAAQMLIHAFAGEVTQDIDVPELQDYIQNKVHEKLIKF